MKNFRYDNEHVAVFYADRQCVSDPEFQITKLSVKTGPGDFESSKKLQNHDWMLEYGGNVFNGVYFQLNIKNMCNIY